jgi:stage V sporulation protein D (sporulation-specific penicillin-binding protein)
VAFVVLGLRLVYLQVIRHAAYLRKAQSVQMRDWTIYARRGSICDRNGVPLAESVMRHTAFADPTEIRKPRATSAALAHVLDIEEDQLYSLLRRPDTRFVRLQRGLSDPISDRIEALRLRGIGLQLEPARRYPKGAAAAQTIGFVGTDATQPGLAGLEASLNHWLAGRNGRLVAEIDARGALIPGRRIREEPPVDGCSVVVTIDAEIQAIAEAQLRQAVEAHGARGGTIVVMDPRSGEILALASQPSFDPNRPLESPPENWINPAVTCAYEPGSTYKLVMACAALEERLMGPRDTITCHGALQVGNRVIHCAHDRAHGPLDLASIVEQSCNIGAATVTMRLGQQRFYKYVKRLGFCQPLGLGLGAEAPGSVPSPRQTWSQIRLANLAFGQGITVTPVQLLAAYCAVANDGILPRPHLVKRVIDPEGKTVKEFDYQGRRALSQQVAHQVRDMLVRVVDSGTGKAARIAGYQVAGKTGTAQKPCPGVGYASGKHIGSFVGFMPASQPKLGIIVVIDEPGGAGYGGVVAAPAFRHVAIETMAYLGIPPTQVAYKSPRQRTPTSPGQ